MNEGARRILDEILSKPASMLDGYEIEVIRSRRGYLTGIQLKQYAAILEDKEDYSKLTIPELRNLCEKRSIDIPSETTLKADIIALLGKADEKKAGSAEK